MDRPPIVSQIPIYEPWYIVSENPNETLWQHDSLNVQVRIYSNGQCNIIPITQEANGEFAVGRMITFIGELATCVSMHEFRKKKFYEDPHRSDSGDGEQVQPARPASTG